MTIDEQISALIQREGGYSDHPADKGGPTMYGVTEQVARAYGYRGDMRRMPITTAHDIYLERYWTGPRFDQVGAIYARVGEEVFDTGANMGQARAAKMLQRALNLLNRGASDYPDIGVDGAIGRMTIAALNGYRDRRGKAGSEGEAVLLWMLRAFRTTRYAEIAEADPSQEVFEYGWVARQVRAAA